MSAVFVAPVVVIPSKRHALSGLLATKVSSQCNSTSWLVIEPDGVIWSLSTLNPIGDEVKFASNWTKAEPKLDTEPAPPSESNSVPSDKSRVVPVPKVNVLPDVPKVIFEFIVWAFVETKLSFSLDNSTIAAFISVALNSSFPLTPWANDIDESTVLAPSISVIKLPISVSLVFISPCNSLIAPAWVVALVFNEALPNSVCNCTKAPVIVLLLAAILLIFALPNWVSCSAIAALTVEAVVPIAPDVIVPSSASNVSISCVILPAPTVVV